MEQNKKRGSNKRERHTAGDCRRGSHTSHIGIRRRRRRGRGGVYERGSLDAGSVGVLVSGVADDALGVYSSAYYCDGGQEEGEFEGGHGFPFCFDIGFVAGGEDGDG